MGWAGAVLEEEGYVAAAFPARRSAIARRREAARLKSVRDCEGFRPARGHSLALGFNQETKGVSVWCPGGRLVGTNAIDRRKDLAFAKSGRKLRAFTIWAFELEVDQAIQGDRRRHLTLDERIDLAHVAGDHRHKSERAAPIPPRQTGRDVDLAAVTDPRLKGGSAGLMASGDGFDHDGPLKIRF